ncbi:HMA2 domain-containing protein [Pontibacillus sp. HMF3514]|uniref:HMA2 domain-containing protein n=1 Tax=Pontibacillus sp. HMF3514 TaxID=2692425 RepID=UPI001F27FB9C|nr:hypothetical protein [Pontibacillus sp. HMF3514]
MEVKYAIIHEIPGRLRIIIPALGDKKEYHAIEYMFSSLNGIKDVKIEPIIQSMVIEYNSDVVSRKNILEYISLFFKQTDLDPLDNLMVQVKPNIRKDIFRSLISGLLILIAYTRKTIGNRPDTLDYAVVISTAYTVLSHGKNKFSHPDVITGIVSMFSLGTKNILHVSLATWAVNLLEIFHDIKRSQYIH